MEEEEYYVITNDFEGKPRLDVMSRDDLKRALEAGTFGGRGVDFSEAPIGMTIEGWENRGLIIKGRAVIPKAKITVTEWEV